MTTSRARRRDRRVRTALAIFSLALGLGFAALACGTATPSVPPASAVAPGSANPSGSGGAGPKTTPWPGNAVLGIEGLGVADSGIREAINDFGRGVATEDLALMRRAADGLTKLDVLLPRADQIDVYEPMRPLAAKVRETVPRIVDAATRLRDAIDAGNAEAIAPASRDLAAALTDYADLQPEIASWVNQSIEQKRILLR